MHIVLISRYNLKKEMKIAQETRSNKYLGQIIFSNVTLNLGQREYENFRFYSMPFFIE